MLRSTFHHSRTRARSIEYRRKINFNNYDRYVHGLNHRHASFSSRWDDYENGDRGNAVKNIPLPVVQFQQCQNLIQHQSNFQLQQSQLFCSSLSNSLPAPSSSSKNHHRHQYQQHYHLPHHTRFFLHRQLRHVHNHVPVSKHNNELKMTKEQVMDVCENKYGLSCRDGGEDKVVVKVCPFCHPTNDKPDNHYKLFIFTPSGGYYCHRCGAKGSWYDFKARLGGYEISSGITGGGGKANSGTNGSGTATKTPIASNRVGTSYGGKSAGSNQIRQQQKQPPQYNEEKGPLPMPTERENKACVAALTYNTETLEYLQQKRGLNKRTIDKYGVGCKQFSFPSKNGTFETSMCLTFPWKMRAYDIEEQEKLRGVSYTWPDEESESEGGEDDGIEGVHDYDIYEKEEEEKGPFVLRRIKARSIQNKGWQRLHPSGGGWGLFGFHLIPPDEKEIVITEGEFDAMAVYQDTGKRAVSLPNGCRHLPVEVIPMLERFERIYLWMDNDTPGQEGAEKFAKKLGRQRCFIVKPPTTMPPPKPLPAVPNDDRTNLVHSNDSDYRRLHADLHDDDDTSNNDDENTDEVNDCSKSIVKKPSSGKIPKDANEALLLGYDLQDMLDNAQHIPHDGILQFSELRTQVLHEILNPNEYVGVAATSLPMFTRIIKGFRRGELTVITGPTGAGKTTFLGQLSVDFCENDINTLWGSFEIKNTRLIHKLLQQYSREPLPKIDDPKRKEKLMALADRFESLPMYFMKFHGGTEIDQVLDAMEYAAYVKDVEHIILDNLQFMLTRQKETSSFDKYDVQDRAIEKFRKFATEHNIHITLVVHPRKEQEGEKLSISSIYGSAKVTQEADTVLVLQKTGNRKYIEVKKNRFDGTLGYSPLYFVPSCCRYQESEVAPTGGKQQQSAKQKLAVASVGEPHAYWNANNR